MFQFGNSKKDDSKLGFGVPSLSLGSSSGVLGKATNTLQNTEKKVENFLFGSYGSGPETYTEASRGTFGLGGRGGLSLGFNNPSSHKPKHHKPSASPQGFGLPSLSNLGSRAKNDLEKAGSAIEDTGEKAIDLLFGKKPRPLPVLSLPSHTITTGGNLGSIKANDTSLGISLGEGKSSIGASLSLPTLTGIKSEVENDLGKVGGAIENTGEKAIDFLFGKKPRPLPVLSLPSHTITTGGNLGSIKANDTSLGISLGEGKSSIGASLSLPTLTGIKSEVENDLGKVGGAIENTGEKAIDFLFGKKPRPLPGLSLPSHPITTDGNLGSIKANDTSLDISLGEGKSSIGASLSLPTLTGIKSEVENDLGKVGGAIENTGKKAIDFLFGGKHKAKPTVVKNESIPDHNAPSIPGFGISLDKGILDLPNLPASNSTIKNNLEKVDSSLSASLPLDIKKGILDTSEPSLGITIGGMPNVGNLGTIKANDTSIGVSLGGKGTSSIGASLNIPTLSEAKNNLDKVNDAIEDTGKKAMNALFGGAERGHLTPGSSLEFGTTSVDKTVDLKKGTTGVPIDSTLGGRLNGSIDFPAVPSVKTGATRGSLQDTTTATIEKGSSKIGIPFLSTLSGTKVNDIPTDFSGLPTSSATISFNDGSLNKIPSVTVSTTYPSFTSTQNPLFGGTDEMFDITNNITEEENTSSSGIEEAIDDDLPVIKDVITNEGQESTTAIADISNLSHRTVDINTSTESSSIFNGNGFSTSYNLTTESEKHLKKIEETLRGRFDVNLPTSSSTESITTRKKHNVTTTPEYQKSTTESVNPVNTPTVEYSYTQSSTTQRPRKPKPATIPPYFLVPNSNITFGEGSEPVLPPSVFDNPTGEKAPFIPILPSSPTDQMGGYNVTERGGNSNSPPTADNLSVVTYGAIGIGIIAVISIIIAFIYKAIKKARGSSSGGSYSPTSHHKELQESRKSSSNSQGNEGNGTVVDSHVEQMSHAVVNETNGEVKKNIRNVKSRAPDPQKNHDESPVENANQSDFNSPGPSNIEVLNLELTYDPKGKDGITRQEDCTKKELPTDDANIIHEQTIPKKNIIPINKPPRNLDKTNASIGKFTSDKTAASNLNEDSLRSLGQALGGILKDQMPELGGNHVAATASSKRDVRNFGNDSDDLTSCTPPTTPTELSDQETSKNDNKIEQNKTQKSSNVGGAEVEGDAFFSSGEMEIDTGSEYFSADESYAFKESTVKSVTLSKAQEVHSNTSLRKEKEVVGHNKASEGEFVSEDGRKKSIEEDISAALKISGKFSTDKSFQENLNDIDPTKIAGRQRGITMCEDQLIDMEVQEILKGKEQYQPPSEDSSLEDANNSIEGLGKSDRNIPPGEASIEDIFEEMNSKNLPRNAHLQKIIKPSVSAINQNNSGLDAVTVVDEIISTSKLGFVDTGLKTSGIAHNISSIETEETRVHLEEKILNMKNANQDSLMQSKTTIDTASISDRIDLEITGASFSEEMKNDTTTTIEKTEQRNLNDYIIPKSLPISIPHFEERKTLTEDQTGVGKEDFSAQSTVVGDSEASSKTPKWYVPFESTPQEFADPSRGNSEGLYIALSEETKFSPLDTEDDRKDSTTTSGSLKKSCAFITIHGDHDGPNEGWPSHLPKNGNGLCGLGVLNTMGGNSTIGAIQEETSSSKAAGSTNLEDIPKFELPNMDKRLMKKRKLRRRQIKSLDSGVHGYYGEYIDLVEFPELEAGQKEAREEQKTIEVTDTKNDDIAREIKEIKIEEDVVTILPDGSIREEKIIIDKITSN